MPEIIRFDRLEIDNLTLKLGAFATGLTTSEWALLLAIFAAAADKVQPSPDTKFGTLPAAKISGDGEIVEDPGEADAEALREQLLQSYTPGKPPLLGFGDSVTPR